MSTGIENESVVDLVTVDNSGEEIAFIMIASAPWTEDQVLALQAKTQAYIDLVESGQFLRDHPSAKGKRIRFQLDTSYPLTELAAEFVRVASEQWLKPLGLRFVVYESMK